jgi:uncharacterized protein (DUF1501 family)
MLGLGHPPLADRSHGRRLLFQPREGPAGDVLVCLFLRGGADGLHLVAPYGDAAYYAQRPRIAVPRPDDTRVPAAQRGVALDGFFALNPALAPLRESFQAGHLAIVHAAGSPDQSRSHFSAMETMERGVADGATTGTGWLGRHLQTAAAGSHSPLRALAIGDTLPQSLEGALGATAVDSLAAFRLTLPAAWSTGFHAALASLYAEAEGPLAEAGRETRRLLQALEHLQPEKYRPEGGARYPNSDFGRGLAQIAQLIKAQLGLEVACLDLGGWDSHVGQEPLLEGLMRDLAGGLAAFHADLGSRIDRVTLLAMSEFGRRVRENGGLGTDHGRATCFWLMGGSIRGGRVVAKSSPGACATRRGRGSFPAARPRFAIFAGRTRECRPHTTPIRISGERSCHWCSSTRWPDVHPYCSCTRPRSSNSPP